jgi:thioredoxin 1
MTARVENLTLENFENLVVDSNQPVLVDFYADWCAPCRVIGPVVDEFADDHVDRVGVYKVDVDSSPELAARFGVRSIPTLVLFRNGTPVETLVGVVTKGQLNSLVEKPAA